MPKKYKDIEIGDIYGRWTVIEKSDKRIKNRAKYWKCKCSCVNETIRDVGADTLKRGTSVSCGCYAKENPTPNKYEDISEEKFSLLTAIEPVGKNKCGQTIWKCLCNCGKYSDVNISSLKSGSTKSCGCLLYKSSENQRIDLTGKQFGMLKVIAYIGHSNGASRKNKWKCQCDCSNSNYLCDTSSLMTGKRTDCGCINKNDLTGKIFDRLTVIQKDDYWTNKYKCITYKCRCACGTIKYIRNSSLVTGSIRSCGCINSDLEDLVGKQYNELTVLSFSRRKYYNDKNFCNIWKCKCSCGNIVEVSQSNLKFSGVKSCGCIKKFVGEEMIQNFLDTHMIKTIKQYRFDQCRNKNTLPFDFYLPKYNILIEYQGEQHYTPVDFAGRGEEWALDNFNLCKKNDQIKQEYCKNNNIPLIEIPYWEKDNMEYCLISELSKVGINILN